MHRFKLRALAAYIILIPVLFSCGSSYDPAIETPDIDAAGLAHGYILTSLGCLLFSPLAYAGNDGFNVQILKDSRELSSKGYPYSSLQKEIVFEFQRNGDLKYWFKKDYIVSPFDSVTLEDGTKSLSHSILHGDQVQLKHLYTGKWDANFKDSTLVMDFGKNDFGLPLMSGKYTSLGTGILAFQQTILFDSLINGKKEVCRKNINSFFESY